MAGTSTLRSIFLAACILAGGSLTEAAEPGSGIDLIGVETGASGGITVRLGEDLASLVDDGATHQVHVRLRRAG